MKFSDKAILNIDLEPTKSIHIGKVRNLYEVDGKLLIVASDRLSAFDCVFPNGIPGKGQILTAISNHWFKLMDFVNNHLVETDVNNFPAELQKHKDVLENRSVLVKKCRRVDIECIVRGYVAGSGWKDYQNNGAICGHKLPSGMKLAEKLPEPIFTPSTKADEGHDENISIDAMKNIVGAELSSKIEELSKKLYVKAYSLLYEKGIIIADTKFEFGLDENDEIVLIDEIFTPDSSRFWPMDTYKVGTSPESFDKQFVRDFVEGTDWDKKPPAPVLPDEIINKTREKYLSAYNIITSL